ncbi:cupin domain-containing protein [Myroides sp. LJL119]
MNLKDLHTPHTRVSAVVLFKSQDTTTISLEFKKDALLKEHTTPVKALLLCVEGLIVYQQEDLKLTLKPGDFVNIEPLVKHWVTALQDSQAVLIK